VAVWLVACVVIVEEVFGDVAGVCDVAGVGDVAGVCEVVGVTGAVDGVDCGVGRAGVAGGTGCWLSTMFADVNKSAAINRI